MAKVLPVKPSRMFPNANVVHGIRARIKFGPNPAAGEYGTAAGRIHIGTIPGGSMILGGVSSIGTPAFTAGATINIGQDTVSGGAADSIMKTADIAPGTSANAKPIVPTVGYVASDTPIYLTIGGTAIAAGSGDFLVQFYPARD
jgi:hypothetical protein